MNRGEGVNKKSLFETINRNKRLSDISILRVSVHNWYDNFSSLSITYIE